jgi:hypothetical protein
VGGKAIQVDRKLAKTVIVEVIPTLVSTSYVVNTKSAVILRSARDRV